MDEFQSPKATRKYPIQRNLAAQPDSLDDLADDLGDQAAAETTVVELPGRSAQLDAVSEAPITRRSSAKRKSSSAAKRKSQPIAVQKTQPSFRQFQDMQQPFAEELRRLEAQAERINQLLVERANRRMQFEQAVEQVNRSPEPPAKRRSPRPSTSASPAPEMDDTETLRAQAERIKQRLAELEAAMQEAASSLRQLPEAEEDPVDETWSSSLSDANPVPESEPSVSEDERSRHNPISERSRPDSLSERDVPRAARANHRSMSKRSLPWPQVFQLPKKPLDRIGDAAVWIAVATAIRLSSQTFLVSYPALAPVVTLLMLAPAAIAVYLAVFVPSVGSISIYRLFLIMLGFLLGGRL